jgi:hypothetical protein
MIRVDLVPRKKNWFHKLFGGFNADSVVELLLYVVVFVVIATIAGWPLQYTVEMWAAHFGCYQHHNIFVYSLISLVTGGLGGLVFPMWGITWILVLSGWLLR